MIYSLTGKVSMIDENTIVVNTGSVAFEVICSSYTAYALANKPEEQTVLTYLQVREDAMCLYGFKDVADSFDSLCGSAFGRRVSRSLHVPG